MAQKVVDDRSKATHLTKKEKYSLLGKSWLTSKHISVINKMMIPSDFAVSGFKETTLVPILEKDNTWRYPANGFEGRISPTVNIYHNNVNHWVYSFQFENDYSLYVLDSNLGRIVEKCLKDSLKIQLSPINGNGKQKLKINLQQVQQQNSGHDCGLFAIANMVEFVADRYSGLNQGYLTFSFIPGEMHKHFVKCLEQNNMEQFPQNWHFNLLKSFPLKSLTYISSAAVVFQMDLVWAHG